MGEVFPALTGSEWDRTSPQDEKYNCIAWTFGDMARWWEPVEKPTYDPTNDRTYYWPFSRSDSDDVLAYVELYEGRRYVACADGALEPGYEKIALYVRGGQFQHVAWQAEDGWWWSKLGCSWDIRHAALDALDNHGRQGYGSAAQFFKRPRRSHRGSSGPDDAWKEDD